MPVTEMHIFLSKVDLHVSRLASRSRVGPTQVSHSQSIDNNLVD